MTPAQILIIQYLQLQKTIYIFESQIVRLQQNKIKQNNHMKKTNLEAFKQTISQIFIRTQPNPLYLIFLFIIRFFVLMKSSLDIQEILNIKLEDLHDSSLRLMQVLFLSFQLILLGFIIWKIHKGKKLQNSRINPQIKNRKFTTQIIGKLINYSLISVRVVFIIPAIQYFFKSQNNALNESYTDVQIISIVNLTIFLMILYPMSGLIFFNKIALKENILSFPYILNIESLTYVYLPVHIFLKLFYPKLTNILGLLYFVFCFITVYIHPVLTYRNNKINQFGTLSVISQVTLVSMIEIMEIQIVSIQKLLILLTFIFIFSSFLHLLQAKRMRQILLMTDNEKNTLIYSASYFQNLLFFIINFKIYQNQVKLFLINSVQQVQNPDNKQIKPILNIKAPKNQNQNQKTIKLINFQNPFKIKAKQIIMKLGQVYNNQVQLQTDFYKLIQLKFRQRYDPEILKQLNLGKGMLLKSLNHQMHVHILLSQTLMNSQKKILKVYTYVKLFDKLTNQIQQTNFITDLNDRCIIFMINECLSNRRKNDQNYNSKALKYFQFQLQKQRLSKQMLQACQNRIELWEQFQQGQCKQSHLRKAIETNYCLQNKILSNCKYILKRFQISSFAIFDLVGLYNNLVLNGRINTHLSEYHFFTQQFSKNLQEIKAQNQESLYLGNLHNSYAMDKVINRDVGIFLIDMDSQDYQIQWANQTFWFQYCCSGSQQKSQIYWNRKFSVMSLMLAQMQQSHKFYFRNFVNSLEQLNKIHPQQSMVFFNLKKNTFQNVKLEFQFLPSLINGFKIVGFVHKQKEKIIGFEWILRNNFSLVSYTDSFLGECQDFFENPNQQKQVNDINQGNSVNQYFEKFSSNPEFIEYLKNIEQNQFKANQIKTNSHILNKTIHLQHLDFQINLIRKIPYSQIQINNNTENTKYLYHLKLINLLAISQQQTIDKYEELTSNCNKTLNTLSQRQQKLKNRSGENNNKQDVKQLKTNKTIQSGKIDNVSKTNSQVYQIIDDILVEQTYKFEQSSKQQVIKIEKIHQMISSLKTPKRIIIWRVITLFLSIVILASIISNIAIFLDRQNLYMQKSNDVHYFGNLITQISGSIISLRQYNYYAYVYSPQSPYIQQIIKRMYQQQGQIQISLQALKEQLTDRWTATDVSATSYNIVEDSAYVVLSKYMLSPITYISQAQPELMAFPIFIELQYQSQMPVTKTRLNYLQAVYNGLYLALTDIGQISQNMLKKIETQLLSYQSLYFLYSSFVGCLCLAFFMAESIFVESKSEGLNQQVGRLFSKYFIPKDIVIAKLDSLRLFKENFNMSYRYQQHNDVRNSAFDIMTRISLNSYKEIIYKFKDAKCLSIFNIQKQDILNDQTDRQLTAQKTELKLDQKHSNSQGISSIIKNNQIPRQKERNTLQCRNDETNPFSISTKQKLTKMLFYLVICIPTLAYFIGVVLGGIMINEKIIYHLELTSQIHKKLSNQQLIYLMTRQTAYYETFITDKIPDWNAFVMSIVEEAYANDRLIQKKMARHQESGQLAQLLKKLQYGNLCQYMDDHLDIFSQSKYHNITYTQQQCYSIGQQVMTKGLKQVIVSFLQNSVQLNNLHPSPQLISIQQRFEFLQKPQLKEMKIILAYIQKFMDLIIGASQQDLREQVKSFIREVVIFMCLSVFGLVLLFVTIFLRWKKLLGNRKNIQSLISLISLNTIACSDVQNGTKCQNSKIREQFINIGWGFYQ